MTGKINFWNLNLQFIEMQTYESIFLNSKAGSVFVSQESLGVYTENGYNQL